MVMPKVYAAEFRRRAVALARSGRPVGQLAVDLQVSEATLFRWVA
jgi:transposase-like protein